MLLLPALLACTSAAPTEPAAPTSVEVIAAPERDAPSPDACDASESINTRVSVAKATVVIDHFERGARSERVTVDFADVERVEHEVRADPIRCAVIWLVLRDGSRILFDDDAKLDLSDRARRLAETVGAPFEGAVPAPVDPGHATG